MRKLLALVLVLALALPLFAVAEGTYELALVTDVGNIDDQSFNQFSWQGVKEYAAENGKTFAYYDPSEDSTNARLESITAAVEKGAKALLLPVSCRRQLFDLSDDMATKLDIEFYQDGRDALLKALAE